MTTKRAAAQDLINRVRTLRLAGQADDAEALREEAEAAVKATAPRDRKALGEELADAFTVESSASTALAIASYHEVEGIDPIVNAAVRRVRDAVDAGLKAADMARSIAEDLLEARLKMRTKEGLPDVVAERKFTKDIAHDTFVKAREGVTESDVHRWATHKSLAKAVRNRMSDVVVARLQSLDEHPENFPADALAQAKAAFPKLSNTEAVYALYEAKGTKLPRKGRTQLAREDAQRRAALVKAAMAGELTSSDDEEPDEEELARDMAALERVERGFLRTTRRAASLTNDQRNALKARINEMITNLAAAAAGL
ncbi:hypothetical protein OHB41_03680 [Streptomyces sp. NBC_01571]|uniref:hypothetical protein n=1 Tax=Streptomyces sp. NBC_01571 TaxID=2975883 RepID=UPI00224FE9F0|nr:hypothetical protein [Streptomyces sp. NBC_01571]MCX4572299.1 hypothetical protein [Streptomyces sp. NBC_01571]